MARGEESVSGLGMCFGEYGCGDMEVLLYLESALIAN